MLFVKTFQSFNSELTPLALVCVLSALMSSLNFILANRGPERARSQVNKLMSVFYASVLLLIMNFVITLSKQLRIHEAIAEWIRRLL